MSRGKRGRGQAGLGVSESLPGHGTEGPSGIRDLSLPLPTDGWDPNGHKLPGAAAMLYPRAGGAASSSAVPRAGHGLSVKCQGRERRQ